MNTTPKYKQRTPMKDYLLNLIQYTQTLGLELVKVEGSSTETKVFANQTSDPIILVEGLFNNPLSEFEGIFGMPNLSKLKTILSFDEYNNAVIQVKKKTDNEGNVTPETIHFQTQNSDFVNNYRLMDTNVVKSQVKNAVFKGATWNISFEPNLASILRLKKQAQANSEETTFMTKTENNELKIYFGDPSTHSGNFVFESNLNGSLSRVWHWPVKAFLSIMDLPGDKVVQFADAGVVKITIDSGLATWVYYLPAMSK